MGRAARPRSGARAKHPRARGDDPRARDRSRRRRAFPGTPGEGVTGERERSRRVVLLQAMPVEPPGASVESARNIASSSRRRLESTPFGTRPVRGRAGKRSHPPRAAPEPGRELERRLRPRRTIRRTVRRESGPSPSEATNGSSPRASPLRYEPEPAKGGRAPALGSRRAADWTAARRADGSPVRALSGSSGQRSPARRNGSKF